MALSSEDWRIKPILVLVRTFHRLMDAQRLELSLQAEDNAPGWRMTAEEACELAEATIGAKDGRDLRTAYIGNYESLGVAIIAGEAFGQRWLEAAPGTSIATYVQRPKEISS